MSFVPRTLFRASHKLCDISKSADIPSHLISFGSASSGPPTTRHRPMYRELENGIKSSNVVFLSSRCHIHQCSACHVICEVQHLPDNRGCLGAVGDVTELDSTL